MWSLTVYTWRYLLHNCLLWFRNNKVYFMNIIVKNLIMKLYSSEFWWCDRHETCKLYSLTLELYLLALEAGKSNNRNGECCGRDITLFREKIKARDDYTIKKILSSRSLCLQVIAKYSREEQSRMFNVSQSRQKTE